MEVGRNNGTDIRRLGNFFNEVTVESAMERGREIYETMSGVLMPFSFIFSNL